MEFVYQIATRRLTETLFQSSIASVSSIPRRCIQSVDFEMNASDSSPSYTSV